MNKPNNNVTTQELKLTDFEKQEVFEKNIFNKSLAYKDLPLNILPCENQTLENLIINNIEIFNITKLVYDKSEDTQEKLKMMYTSFYQYDLTTSIMLKRTNGKTSFYLLVKKNNSEHSAKAEKLVEGLLEGIFPGIESKRLKNGNEPTHKMGLVSGIEKHYNAFSGLQVLPSAKNNQKNYIQGLEKIAHSITLDNFTMILLAEPINKYRLSESKHFFEQAYTERSSLATISGNITQSATEGGSTTNAHINTNNTTTSNSNTKTKTEGGKKKDIRSKTGSFIQTILPAVGATLGELAGGVAGPVGLALGGVVGSSIGSTLGGLASDLAGNEKKTTYTAGASTTVGISTSIAETLSTNLTKGQTINYTQENKSITNELQLIDTEINRLTQGLSKGMWQYASYFFTENIEEAKLCTDITQGILLGEDLKNTPSYSFSIDNEISEENLAYAKTSVLALSNIRTKNGIEFGLPITSNELAYGLPFPEKSFDNLTVLQLEPFGINPPKVNNHNNKVEIGNVRHMDKDLKNTVELDKNLFTSHVFVAGSTGSGKSNTITTILNNCANIPFLIIEPSKGEYKNILGNHSDVNVFGTNYKKTDLLKINPFSFPESITLTEHVDKLVDIFNSAWFISHAMITILRSALEHAYENKGWIISTSQYIYKNKEYPDFINLIESLKFIINCSNFNDELKGNYTGALTERVKDLAKGFYKDIFVKDELSEAVLFDNKCIIDLSNIGSVKIKSLITGFLFVKLQEYRIQQRDSETIQANANLKHITVLEEASILLPRIETYQERANNTSSQSVKMISNAVAEMRTYGEGFIIVDQSPEKIDNLAIKNTNTKIIHRLPYNEDCKIAGLSAGAKEQQLGQLATLEKGIALIFQSGWSEPVLCRIKKSNLTEKTYEYQAKISTNIVKEQAIQIVNNIQDINNINDQDKDTLNKLLKILDTYEYALKGYKNNQLLALQHFNNQLSLKLFDENPLDSTIETNIKIAIATILQTTNVTHKDIIFNK